MTCLPGALAPPTALCRADGTPRFAYITFLMRNDSYLPGALLLADGLRRQRTRADLVCLVTPEITAAARSALRRMYDHVRVVPATFVPHARRQQRQDRPFFFTRLHAWRLGADGDLGLHYEKIVLLDADVLPLRGYDHLFTLPAPAGILNERREHFVQTDGTGHYVWPARLRAAGVWHWHEVYAAWPHGTRIPQAVTDRVATDATNMGVNSGVLVLEPSCAELARISAALDGPAVRRMVSELMPWPDMQYLTLHYSGRWTNVDVRFAGLNGYPCIGALYGVHYAGAKPWAAGRGGRLSWHAQHADFCFWHKRFRQMMAAWPELARAPRLARLASSLCIGK